MGRKARDKKTRPKAAAASGVAPAPETPSSPPDRTPRAAAGRPGKDPSRITPRAIACMFALAVATSVVYAGALDNPFVLDDPVHITKSAEIRRPLDPAALVRDPRAVVTASLRWNYLGGGLDVTGYHVLNIAAHVLAGCLLFLLVRGTPASGGPRRRDAVATVAALVFLLHPMQTESVTYVIQRAEIFAGAALLACLVATMLARDGAGRASTALLAVACVFGAYSKPSFAVAPALMVLYDWLFLARGRISAMKARGTLYAVAGAAAVATFALTRASGSFTSASAGFQLEGITPADYLSAQFGVVVHYLGVALWPADLCFDCGYRGAWPVLAGPLGDSVALPALLLAGLAAASLLFVRRQPWIPFAVLGTFVALLPTSSVVPLADFYVEHRMYLPIAFLAAAASAAAGDGADVLASRFGIGARPLAAALAAVAATVVVALGAATMARNDLLDDPIALMEDALEKAPQNERVQYNLANALKREGRFDEAIPHYEAAIRLRPQVVRSYQNLGSVYLRLGETDKALEVYAAGARVAPDMAMAHRNVAVALLALGRNEEALEAAKRSLVLDPRSANGHRLAGDALMRLGRRTEAIDAWRLGLENAPGDASLRERLRTTGPR